MATTARLLSHLPVYPSNLSLTISEPVKRSSVIPKDPKINLACRMSSRRMASTTLKYPNANRLPGELGREQGQPAHLRRAWDHQRRHIASPTTLTHPRPPLLRKCTAPFRMPLQRRCATQPLPPHCHASALLCPLSPTMSSHERASTHTHRDIVCVHARARLPTLTHPAAAQVHNVAPSRPPHCCASVLPRPLMPATLSHDRASTRVLARSPTLTDGEGLELTLSAGPLADHQTHTCPH